MNVHKKYVMVLPHRIAKKKKYKWGTHVKRSISATKEKKGELKLGVDFERTRYGDKEINPLLPLRIGGSGRSQAKQAITL